jgi:hypothetical protein
MPTISVQSIIDVYTEQGKIELTISKDTAKGVRHAAHS